MRLSKLKTNFMAKKGFGVDHKVEQHRSGTSACVKARFSVKRVQSQNL